MIVQLKLIYNHLFTKRRPGLKTILAFLCFVFPAFVLPHFAAPQSPHPVSQPTPAASVPTPAATAAFDLTVNIAGDRQEARVGDVIPVTVTVNPPAESEIIWPAWDKFWPGVPVVQEEPPRTGLVEGRTVTSRRILVQVNSLDTFTLAALTIQAKDKHGAVHMGESNPLSIRVTSILPTPDPKATAAGPPDIKPIKDLVPISRPWQDYWPFLAAALVLAGIIVYVLWRTKWRRNQATAAAPPLPPPDQTALAALEELERTTFYGLDGLRLFYYRLSLICRRYLEDMWNFPAVEFTTEEIIPVLRGLDLGESGQEMNRLLTMADLVKFADAVPGTDEKSSHLALARGFIKTTAALAEAALAAPNAGLATNGAPDGHEGV
ncbi:MAG: hypothetical protein HQK58_00955 [Deltaproteobacteria bacterium]|nr:hypothetical protein [Deltaproteobacteria bacterium]